MDNKRLQTEFDEYFKGADLPANITADAKAQVKPRRRDIRKWFLRLAPVAAAFVLIIAASVAFVNRFAPNDKGDANSSGGTDKDEATSKYSYYSIDGLTNRRMDPYSSTTVKGLEFTKELAYSANSNVALTVFYEKENIKLAKAEISLLHNSYRHDVVLYAEYTDEYECFEDLKGYLTGAERYYRGQDYIYNENFDDGENVYMIYTYTGGIKYYLSVITSEPYGYLTYFDFLKNI